MCDSLEMLGEKVFLTVPIKLVINTSCVCIFKSYPVDFFLKNKRSNVYSVFLITMYL